MESDQHPETVGMMTTAEGISQTERGSQQDANDARRLEIEGIGVGQRLEGFVIERRLGGGGMGEVFAATKVATGELVALKILDRASSTHLYRFKREFRAIADLRHPNLVSLHELFVLPGRPAFFTMELVEGKPFTDYVRGDLIAGRVPRTSRLMTAMRQLAEGVHYLHRARCVHRDLKPSNVLVTPEGRIVILDFGLVSEESNPGSGITQQGQILGTPAYMAPEQTIAETGSAVDYYAMGVMLYECLTGELPFRGPALTVIMDKQERDGPDPRTVVNGVPEQLGALCVRLLSREPQQRPTGREILAAFDRSSGSDTSGRVVLRSDTQTESAIPFVGRDAELGQLRAALRDVRETGRTVIVHLEGPSGQGKSALVDRFLSAARREHQALVLRGRCLVRESVAYKGVDAVVDALSVHLRRMNADAQQQLRPRYVGPLTRLFPVLLDIWDEADDPALNVNRSFEPAELRSLGLTALREIFVHLSSQRLLIICVDDLQWANLDGVNLLRWIMRPPGAPAVLLLASFRPDQEHNAVLQALTDAASLEASDVRSLVLGPLSDKPARQLAAALAQARGLDDADLVGIVRRARGNPFYIDQLLATDDATSDADASLDRVVVRRIDKLSPPLRHALACVAVAGGPIARSIVADVLDDASIATQLDELLQLGLLRAVRLAATPEPSADGTGTPPADEASARLDILHDRIREVVLEDLPGDERRALHIKIAQALDPDSDPEALAAHYLEGGQPGRAVAYLQRAAERAAQTLAFARAVEFYRRALEALAPDAAQDQRTSLRRGLATQLANLGRGIQAADLLLELAAEASPEDAEPLRQEATRQLIRSGRVDQSHELLAGLLQSVGETLPRTRRAAIMMFVLSRLRLWVRGWTYECRPRDQIDPQRLLRLETLLMPIMGGQEVILSAALHARALPLALDAGEPKLLGMAIGSEVLVQAGRGRFERAAELSAQCRELVALTGDVELELMTEMNLAYCEMLSYRTDKARLRMARLLPRLVETPGVGWMRSDVAVRYLEVSLNLGHYALVRQQLPARLALARERGNLHEMTELEAYGAMLASHFGDRVRAKRHLQSARNIWTSTHYGFAKFIVDVAEVSIALHQNEPDAALRLAQALDTNMRQAGLHRFRMVKDVYERAFARCLLLQVARRASDRAAAKRLRRLFRRWRRSDDPAMRGEAMLNDAALCSLAGDDRAARLVWRQAAEHFDDCGMRAHLAAARSRLADVTEGAESDRFTEHAQDYFVREGIEQQAHLVTVLAGPRAPR